MALRREIIRLARVKLDKDGVHDIFDALKVMDDVTSYNALTHQRRDNYGKLRS